MLGGLLAIVILIWAVAVWPTAHAPVSIADPERAPEPREPVRGSTPVVEPAAPPPTPSAPAEPVPAEVPERKVFVAPVMRAPPAHPAAEPTEPADLGVPLSRMEQGPVAEYTQQFQHEPRDSAAIVTERQIRSAFAPESGSAGVLRDVLCRQTICRIEIRMSKESLGSYVAGMGRISSTFDRAYAYSREGPVVDGMQTVAVYAKRLPPAAATP